MAPAAPTATLFSSRTDKLKRVAAAFSLASMLPFLSTSTISGSAPAFTIVTPLMRLLKYPGGGMVDEALAILAILASHQEGKVAIGQAEPITILIEVIKTGSPRNWEMQQRYCGHCAQVIRTT
ncbi:RING-type E3 ubiquitin transferase [Forsythia ovata]|uniref:RING-type E3 ubiquitin transferase n=1 Tax=Forsythia ovata TaxID=205694 RepID=A0ABD1T620_9LAMI